MPLPKLILQTAALAAITCGLFFLLEIGYSLAAPDGFERGVVQGENWGIVGELDEDLGWRNRASTVGRIRCPEFECMVRINAEGFRDPERNASAASGRKRVAVLGDSIAWGWGVQDDERFSAVLEHEFFKDVEFLNFAVPGYGTDQEFVVLRDVVPAYEPDLVVLCMCMNDLAECRSDSLGSLPKPRFVADGEGSWYWEVAKRRSFGDRLATAKNGWRLWARAESAAAWSWTGGKQGPTPPHDPDAIRYHAQDGPMRAMLEQYMAGFLDPREPANHALHEIARLCEAHGWPLVLTSAPFGHDQYLYEPRFPVGDADRASWGGGTLSPVVRELARELGSPWVDVDLAMLAASRMGIRLHCGDGHPNAAGHRVVAECLAPVLKSMLGQT